MKTFSFTESRTSVIPPPKLILDRITSTILLDQLLIFLPYVPETPRSAPAPSILPYRMVQSFFDDYIFPLFNPILLHVEGVEPDGGSELPNHSKSLPLFMLDYYDSDEGYYWSNLSVLSFKDANTSAMLSNLPLKDVVLVVELSKGLSDRLRNRLIMDMDIGMDLMFARDDEDAGREEFSCRGLKGATVWVHSEQGRQQVLGYLSEKAEEYLDATVVEGRLGRIEVLVRQS